VVPAYTFPKNREDLAALRIVIKEGFSRDMADMLIGDIKSALAYFKSQPQHLPQQAGTSFHH
jgi:glutamate decarboxylase